MFSSHDVKCCVAKKNRRIYCEKNVIFRWRQSTLQCLFKGDRELGKEIFICWNCRLLMLSGGWGVGWWWRGPRCSHLVLRRFVSRFVIHLTKQKTNPIRTRHDHSAQKQINKRCLNISRSYDKFHHKLFMSDISSFRLLPRETKTFAQDFVVGVFTMATVAVVINDLGMIWWKC